MSATISVLPRWKKNSSVAENLEEVAALARARPDLFDKLVVCYVECTDKKLAVHTLCSENTNTVEAAGVLAIAQINLYNDTRRK